MENVIFCALQCTLSLPPENIRKPYGILMFPDGREKVHWKQIGTNIYLTKY